MERKIETRPVIKVLILGSSSEESKKKQVYSYLKDESYSSTNIATIGVNFFYSSNKDIRLQVWDLAGQERFREITSAYLQGSHIVLLCPDNADNLKELLSKTTKIRKSETSIRFYVVAEPEWVKGIKDEEVLPLDKNLKEVLLKKAQEPRKSLIHTEADKPIEAKFQSILNGISVVKHAFRS